jgi:hypothetical protein
LDTDSARRIPRHQHQPGEGLPAPESPINLSDQLPRSYGVTRCVLQARDPRWLHAWWEASEAEWSFALARVGANAAQATPVLRVYNLGTEGPPDLALASASAMAPWWYVPLGQFADAWLFEVPVPGCYYRVEVGLLGPGGAFVPVAASNVAQTPRASPCGLASRRPSAWSGSISRLA